MRLHFEEAPGGWYCIDLDNYDGAPDAGRQIMGWGKTQKEAEEEFLENLAERNETTPRL